MADAHGVPPFIARVARDLEERGHAPITSLGLSANLARRVAGGRRFDGSENVPMPVRDEARTVMTAFSVAKSSMPEGTKRGVERIEGTKALISTVDMVVLAEKAQNRAVLAEGMLLALGKGDANGRLSESVEKLVGPTDDAKAALEVELALNRLLLEAVDAGRGGSLGRALATQAERSQVKSRGGEKQTKGSYKTRAGARNPEFEKKHPRKPKGRTGGGQFDLKSQTTVVQKAVAGQGIRDAAALQEFQRKYGLKPTGKFDPSTIETLLNPPPRSVDDVRREQEANATGKAAGSGSAGAGRNAASEPGKKTDTAKDKNGVDSARGGSGKAVASRADGTVRRGDGMSDPDGDDSARQVQELLDGLGYDLGDAGIDGKYGPVTEAAIRKFQRDHGIAVSGIVDSNTLAELNRQKAKRESKQDEGTMTLSADQSVREAALKVRGGVAFDEKQHPRDRLGKWREKGGALASAAANIERYGKMWAFGGSTGPNLKSLSDDDFAELQRGVPKGDADAKQRIAAEVKRRKFGKKDSQRRIAELREMIAMKGTQPATRKEYERELAERLREATVIGNPPTPGSPSSQTGGTGTNTPHGGATVPAQVKQEQEVLDNDPPGGPEGPISFDPVEVMARLRETVECRQDAHERGDSDEFFAAWAEERSLRGKLEDVSQLAEGLRGRGGFDELLHPRNRVGRWIVSMSKVGRDQRVDERIEVDASGESDAKRKAEKLWRGKGNTGKFHTVEVRQGPDVHEFAKNAGERRAQREYVAAHEALLAAEKSGNADKLKSARARWNSAKEALRGETSAPEQGPGLGGAKRMSPDEYFWNYEFRFDLRDVSRKKQEEVARGFAAAGLKQDAFTRKHVEIVEKVLGKESVARKSPKAPRSLRGDTDPRTPEGEKKGLDFFKTLTMAELRRRQDLTTQQIKMAHDQKNTEALERLQRTHDLLSQAVHEKAFGKSKKVRRGSKMSRRTGHDLLTEASVDTQLEEVKSSAYPSLERKPGKQNWVDKAGGLPSYIERIAKHLHYEKGMTIGHAIATAVNVVKKMCSTGDVNFPGKQNANPKSKAEACAAVASWEQKKAGSKVKEAELAIQESRAAGERPFYPSANEAFLIAEWADVCEAESLRLGESALVTRYRTGTPVWKPQLHPRDRLGQFTDVLNKLRFPSGDTKQALRRDRSVPKSATSFTRGERVGVRMGSNARTGGMLPYRFKRWQADGDRRWAIMERRPGKEERVHPGRLVKLTGPGTTQHSTVLDKRVHTGPNVDVAAKLTDTPDLTEKPLYEIAEMIRKEWKKVNFGAAPYLDAMGTLGSHTENYGLDSGKSIIAYFLSNASTFRGDHAKRIKKELNRRLKEAGAHDVAAKLERLEEVAEERLDAHEAGDAVTFRATDVLLNDLRESVLSGRQR